MKGSAAGRQQTSGDLAPLILLFLLVFLLRLPDLAWHYRDWDEAAMMAQAWALTKGQVLYKDVFQIHPALNIFLFVPFFRFLPADWAPHAVKAMNLLLVFAGAMLVRRIALAWLEDRALGLTAALVYASFFGRGWAQGSYGEFYALIPILLSVRLLWFPKKDSAARFYGIGLLWGLAFFLKQTAVFDAAALFLGFLIFDRRQASQKLACGLRAALCFLAVAAGLGGWFLYKGALNEAARSMLLRPLMSYAASPGVHGPAVRLELFWFSFLGPMLAAAAVPLLAAAAGAVDWPRGRRTAEGHFFAWLWIWLLMDVLGLFLIGRQFTHYLLQAVPVLSLLPLFVLTRFPAKVRASLSAGLLGLLLAYAGVSGGLELRALAASHWVHAPVKASRALALYISRHTQEDDRIFLYGLTNLDVFYLSGRLSNNGIYMYIDMDAEHTHDPGLQAEKEREFLLNPPTVLVVNKDPEFEKNAARKEFFATLLRKDYELKASLGPASVYLRRR